MYLHFLPSRTLWVPAPGTRGGESWTAPIINTQLRASGDPTPVTASPRSPRSPRRLLWVPVQSVAAQQRPWVRPARADAQSLGPLLLPAGPYSQ